MQNTPHVLAIIVSPPASILPRADFHKLMLGALPGLRQQALALTRNRPDADDLVQAAVTNALAAQASFMPATNFRAWMSRILRNRFFSDIRARRDTVTLEDAPSARLARTGGQEEHMAMQELNRSLARLRPDHRLVLMMITVQGLTYEEASVTLGVAVGTLKCRVFRARLQLKGWMLGEPAAPQPDAFISVLAAKAPRARITADPT
jgi:RNA polymerase sigma-70 factor (ECF subfamily)